MNMVHDQKEGAVGRSQSGCEYIILRCRSRDTLALTKRLCGAGLTAWTPEHQRRIRIARCRKMHMITVPTMASYVFLPSGELINAKAVMRRYRCPIFGVMRRDGALVLVKDRELDHLRMLSELERNKDVALLDVGQRAIVTSGAMAEYMVDIIGKVGDINIVTDLSRRWKISIPPWMLKEA